MYCGGCRSVNILVGNTLVGVGITKQLTFTTRNTFFLRIVRLGSIVIIFPIGRATLSLHTLVRGGNFRISYIYTLNASTLSTTRRAARKIVIYPFLVESVSTTRLTRRLPGKFSIVTLSGGNIRRCVNGLVALPLPVSEVRFVGAMTVLMGDGSDFAHETRTSNSCVSGTGRTLVDVGNVDRVRTRGFLRGRDVHDNGGVSTITVSVLSELT